MGVSMSENTAKAACTKDEFDMARKAGLCVFTTQDERAIHVFAELIRDEPLPDPDTPEGAEEFARRSLFRDRLLVLLKELEEEGVLTEGQCAEVWGGDRLDWRVASRPMPPVFGPEP
jgi:hypothetical protein